MFSHLDRLPGLDFPNHQKSWYGRCKHFLPPQQTRFLGKFIKNISSLLAPPTHPPKKTLQKFRSTRLINAHCSTSNGRGPWRGPNGFFLEILRKNNLCTLVSPKGIIEFMPSFQDRQYCSDTKLHTYQSLLAIGWVHRRNKCWQMDLRNFYTRYNCTRVSVHTNKASVFALLVCQNNMFAIYCDYA